MSYRLGKTYEELYGLERATEIKGKLTYRRGKTYEELYGEDKANEIRRKTSKALSGHFDWCKGKGHPHTEEAKERIRLAIKAKWADPNYRSRLLQIFRNSQSYQNRSKKISDVKRQKCNTLEFKNKMRVILSDSSIREKISNGVKQAIPKYNLRAKWHERSVKRWSDPEKRLIQAQKTKETWQNHEIRQVRTQNIQKKRRTIDSRAKTAKQAKKLWSNPDKRNLIIKNISKALHKYPNKKERVLLGILEPFGFEYTGDGSLVVDGKCPDFVNYSKHLIVELYGDYWHKGDDPKQRIRFLKEHGYETLIIWENQLSNTALLNIIANFVERRDSYVV